MARQARKRSSTGIYHIMLRGINKESIFESDDEKKRFIAIIIEQKEQQRIKIYGYCMMDNHVHLIIQEETDDISTLVKRISSSYVYWYNKKHERVGPLFQERFKSECVENDGYFISVLRYIHQNPVKAGIVKTVDKYKWSSYDNYIKEIDHIDYKYGLSFFSQNTSGSKSEFIKYMAEENKTKFLDYDEDSKFTDTQVKEEILAMGLDGISDLAIIEEEKRRQILKKLKSNKGISIRQLSRVTGLCRKMIAKL